MNNYFCVLPFFSYEPATGSTKNIHCCRLAQGTDIAEVQDAIKKQQRSPSCSTCWQLEDRGLPSERQIHNQTFDYYADRDLALIEQDAIDQGFRPKIVKLTTSNLCNSTCITCNASCSSAWAKLEKYPVNYLVMDLPSLDLSEIIQLSFVGGEPLLEKKNFVILEQLIELGNFNCFISIVTNGSIDLTPGQIDILSKFKNLNICLSIDGIGPQFEYLRYPLKWSKLEHNLKQFKKIARHVSVSCMISNLNIFYYDQMIAYFDANQLEYLCKQITAPTYFSPGNLSTDFQQQVLDHNTLHQDQVRSFLQYNQGSIEKFWAEIDRQDQLKGIDIKDYLPELAATRT